MAFLNLFLLLQVFNFDDFRYPQSVVITDFNYIFGTSEHQYCTALPFVISMTSLSNSCALTIPLQFLHTLSPHDTILTEQTKHQALAPSGPMLLFVKNSFVRAEFCFTASARAWQETNDLRNTMKHTAHTYRKHAKCVHGCVCFSNWPTPSPTGKKTILFWTPSFQTSGI